MNDDKEDHLTDDKDKNNSLNFSNMVKNQRQSNVTQFSQNTNTLNDDMKIEEDANESISSQDSFRSHLSNIDK